MEVPLLDLKAQFATIRDEVRAAVDEVLESQRFILGPQVAALEDAVARYCNVEHAVGVASGSDALLLSLKALDVGPGDCVVTVPYTFFATAGTITNLGARPLFVDIDEATYNMDPAAVEAFLERDCSFNLSEQRLIHKPSGAPVKALVPVHLYGMCADMARLSKMGERYRLPIVEDACQAIGAACGGVRAGGLGTLACFSFFPSKNLGGAGDGGMVVTRSAELAARVKLLRAHGAEPKYVHSIVGFNSRLDEIQAAILRVKLRHLDAWAQARCRNAAAYGDAFRAAGLSGTIALPVVPSAQTHVFHQFVIRCPRRNELRAFLESRGIGTEVYYPLPLHEQKCFHYLGYDRQDFPRSRAAAEQTIALPVYPELTEAQRSYVVSTIAEFYSRPDSGRL